MGASQVGTTYGTRFRFEGTGCYIYSDVGDPEGSQVGSVGDLYVRKDMSSSNPPLYAKLSGTNTPTGWVAIAGAGAVSASIFSPQSAVLGLTGNRTSRESAMLSLIGNQPTVLTALTITPASGVLTVTGGTVPEWA